MVVKFKTIYGEPIEFQQRQFNKGQIYDGLLFGFGWAITGACAGPLYAKISTSATAIAVTLLSTMQAHGFMESLEINFPIELLRFLLPQIDCILFIYIC